MQLATTQKKHQKLELTAGLTLWQRFVGHQKPQLCAGHYVGYLRFVTRLREAVEEEKGETGAAGTA